MEVKSTFLMRTIGKSYQLLDAGINVIGRSLFEIAPGKRAYETLLWKLKMAANPVHSRSHCTVRSGVPCYFAARRTPLVITRRVTRIRSKDWREIPRNRCSVP
jgi:hypothetical protein